MTKKWDYSKTKLKVKLHQIVGHEGLEATYGNGDYTVSVWKDVYDGGYALVFTRSDSFIAFERDHVTVDELEAAMRRWQPDLRRWRKVTIDE